MSDEDRVITPDSVNPPQRAMPCATCDAAPGQECVGADDVHPKRATAYRDAMEMTLKDQNRLWANLAEMEEQKANRPRYEDADLDAMSARVAATRGGWEVRVFGGDFVVTHSGGADVAHVGYDDEASAKARAEFIAAAREHMPQLIAELADHRQVRREIHDAMVGIDPAQAEEPTPTAEFIRGLAAERESARRGQVDQLRAELEEARENGADEFRDRAIKAVEQWDPIDWVLAGAHGRGEVARALRTMTATPDQCGAGWSPRGADRPYVCTRPAGHREEYHRSREGGLWLSDNTKPAAGSPDSDLERAKAVAEHWRAAAMAWDPPQPTIAHPLNLVLSALNGETAPEQLGMTEDDMDAARARIAEEAPDA